MRKILIAAILLFSIPASSQTIMLPEKDALAMARPCIPKADTAPTKLACVTANDVDSGALTASTCYLYEGDSDAWFRWGTAAVTTVVDDTKLRAGKTYKFCTQTGLVHTSCKSVAVNGDWRLTICR